MWFIGDIANLLGSLWAGLVPTVIALAFYFCFADAVLITQCLYYNYINSREVAKAEAGHTDGNASNDPTQPLLGSHIDNIGLPGSRRRSSLSNKRRDSILPGPLPTIQEEESATQMWTKNAASVLAVCLIGSVGWVIAWKLGVWKPASTAPEETQGAQKVAAAVLGYLSAVLYLGARIPQIVKNYRERSCEGMILFDDCPPFTSLTSLGLSLLFFILSLLGNATYGAGVSPRSEEPDRLGKLISRQILCHSIELDYFLTNLPWLIGSLGMVHYSQFFDPKSDKLRGTMGEDILIFVQFHMYARKEDTESSSAIE